MSIVLTPEAVGVRVEGKGSFVPVSRESQCTWITTAGVIMTFILAIITSYHLLCGMEMMPALLSGVEGEYILACITGATMLMLGIALHRRQHIVGFTLTQDVIT